MKWRHKNVERRRRSRSTVARRRVVALGMSAGAFLAFGSTPLASAPSAHADIDDLIVDLLDPASWGGLGFDLPGADEAVTNPVLAASSTIDPAALLGGDLNSAPADPLAGLSGLFGVADSGGAASS
jgi:hypothetical protein